MGTLGECFEWRAVICRHSVSRGRCPVYPPQADIVNGQKRKRSARRSLRVLSCLDAAPGSSYPPPQGNESAGDEPRQDNGNDRDARDRIPMRHEEDRSARTCRVSRERAIKPPSCDPGFVPGREQTAHDHPNH